MARAIYLIAYDISEPKTLTKARNCVKAHLLCGQKSFSECWLNQVERELLLTTLQSTINLHTDRLHAFRYDPRKTPILLGLARRASTTPFMII